MYTVIPGLSTPSIFNERSNNPTRSDYNPIDEMYDDVQYD